MNFNVIYFTKGNMFRAVWISEDSYRIQGMNNVCGKRHYDNPKEYISKLLADGWKKVSTADYLKTRYGLVKT